MKPGRYEWVHPTTHDIVKFFPTIPPERGDLVLVNGERRRVKRVVLRWHGRTWTLDGLKVGWDRAR